MSSNNKPRVFFYVQHLLGIGHLRRAELICRAMAADGLVVTMVMGGQPVDGLELGGAELVTLPAVRIGDGGFHDLVDARGGPVDEAWKETRRGTLLDIFRQKGPDILITEAFPFGRRQMRFELLPLLQAAHECRHPPMIVCSVRDILKTGRKPGRAEETIALIEKYYDLILVHGDRFFARLDETFPAIRQCPSKLQYSGIVAESDPLPKGENNGEVIVSAGGGAVGQRLLEIAVSARAHSRFRETPWRILVGPNVEEGQFARLRQSATAGIVVERYRTDFRALLAGAAASISQAGYNTVADILGTTVPAVLVPFDTDNENEQPLRAEKLARMGRVEWLRSSDLTAQSLAAALDRASAISLTEPLGIDLNGAQASVDILRRAFAARG